LQVPPRRRMASSDPETFNTFELILARLLSRACNLRPSLTECASCLPVFVFSISDYRRPADCRRSVEGGLEPRSLKPAYGLDSIASVIPARVAKTERVVRFEQPANWFGRICARIAIICRSANRSTFTRARLVESNCPPISYQLHILFSAENCVHYWYCRCRIGETVHSGAKTLCRWVRTLDLIKI